MDLAAEDESRVMFECFVEDVLTDMWHMISSLMQLLTIIYQLCNLFVRLSLYNCIA